MPGNCNNIGLRDLPLLTLKPDSLARLVPIHPGHVAVHEYHVIVQIFWLIDNLVYRFHSVGGLMNLQINVDSSDLEQNLKSVNVELKVINYQNSRHRLLHSLKLVYLKPCLVYLFDWVPLRQISLLLVFNVLD